MLESFRSTLAKASPTKRILLVGGIYFVIALLVDIVAVDVLSDPGRPGTTITRRTLEAFVGEGMEALLFGTLIHFLEAKTSFFSFDDSKEG